jgi:zinc D-Ala-D-Ala carboxypeptidase
MKLTENFSLEEFLVSQTAARHGIDMTPPQYVISNLKSLCVVVLQPLRNITNSPVRISSGYRPLELNTKIGGSKTSAHIEGRAADFTVIGQTPYETAVLLDSMELGADQIILEFNKWVHVGISTAPRNELLTAYRDSDGVHYSLGHLENA